MLLLTFFLNTFSPAGASAAICPISLGGSWGRWKDGGWSSSSRGWSLLSSFSMLPLGSEGKSKSSGGHKGGGLGLPLKFSSLHCIPESLNLWSGLGASFIFSLTVLLSTSCNRLPKIGLSLLYLELINTWKNISVKF